MKVAIIVATHYRYNLTKSLLEELKVIDESLYDLYLLNDNTPAQEWLGVFTDLPRSIKVFHSQVDRFWSGGMSYLWQKVDMSRYKGVLWLNNDVEIIRESFILFWSVFQNQYPEIVVGNTLDSVSRKMSYGSRNTDGQLILGGDSLNGLALFNGNCVFVNRLAFNILGIIDEDYIHSLGDFDYARRAIARCVLVRSFPQVIGYCDVHGLDVKWTRSDIGFLSRVSSLYSPLGNSHPKTYYKYQRRHFTLRKAILGFIKIHVRLVFPSLWTYFK